MRTPSPEPSADDAARQGLSDLTAALAALRDGALSTSMFCSLARSQDALRQRLPPRYDEVLRNLLDRLESSALFSEESCSFSQKDLVANLTMWVEKAQGTLTAR